MRSLNKKLWRDLWRMKGQNLAIAAVIGAGVTVLVMSLTTLRSLTLARASYYTEQRFGDVFVQLTRAPKSVAKRAANLPGVAAADTRVSGYLTLDMPKLTEPASGQVFSLPAEPGRGLNQVSLLKGTWPDPARPDEVLVSEAFGEAHELQTGDRLKATLRGRRVDLHVVGVGTSPEFLIQLSPGSIFPDPRRFGVFWMAERVLAPAVDMEGAFNHLSLELAGGAVEAEVIRQLDTLLEPYGGSGAIARDMQPSAHFLEDEIEGMRTMAVFSPFIFLGVAAFLLAISMRRLLTLQREQLATLKAFGYLNSEIGWHYAGIALVITLAGSLVGCLAGTWTGFGMAELYQRFYRFPVPVFEPGVGTYLIALGLALLAAALGVFGGLRTALRLQPAEAMQAAPPATYRPLLLERLGMAGKIPVPLRMILRELERRPLKAALTSLGIALAFSIIILGNFGRDALDLIIDRQFGLAERDDARVTFVDPLPGRACHELEAMSGIWRAEPFRAVAVRLRHGPVHRQVGLLGIEPDGDLVRLLNKDGNKFVPDGDGCILSKVLAERLKLEVGDRVRVEVMEGARQQRDLRVSALVNDFSGLGATMRLDALNRLLGEGRVISGAYLQVDPELAENTYADLGDRPGVAMVTRKRAMVDGFLETIAENILRVRLFNLIMASIIAIGVIYSSARIAFSERSRDLATMRVIGLTRGEVATVMLGEFALLTVLAIPLGMLIGRTLCALLLGTMDMELYTFPLVIEPSTWGYASLVVLGAATASNLILLRRISRLDLISALKVKE